MRDQIGTLLRNPFWNRLSRIGTRRLYFGTDRRRILRAQLVGHYVSASDLWWRLSSPAPEPESVLPEDAEVVMHDLDLTSVWISQEQPFADGGVLDWSSL
jgi:hypothetical protein